MSIKVLTILFWLFSNPSILMSQDLYKSSTASVAFFSSAPILDIHAVSDDGLSVIDPETGEFVFKVDIRSFQFPKQKMQEHFNENFMESNSFPTANFRGEIKEVPDLGVVGTYPVTIVGILQVHGKKMNRTIPAILTVKEGRLNLDSEFDVACRDHDIEIPKILWKNIAEVVKVTVKANYKR